MSSATGGRALLRATAVIAPAMTVATLLQYVLQVVAARRLPTGDFGAFGSLLALTVLGAVPLFAVQAIVARRVAVRPSPGDVLRPALRCGLVVGGLAALLAVPFAAFLHLPVAAALLMAAALVPLPLVGAALGLAQGGRRHRAFALLYLAYSGSRLVFVIPILLVHATTTAAMAGVALASFATGVPAAWLVRRGGRDEQVGEPGFGRDVLLTSLALLAVLALASTDLLLARHRLPAADSDLYALGSLGARAVFWLLQFAGVTVYAEIAAHAADARRRTTFLSGLVAVLGVGAVGSLVAAALPSGFVTRMLRPEYGAAVPLLPLFTVLGTALAVAQYLMMAGVARGRRRGGIVLALAATVEGVVLWLLPSPTIGRIAVVACTVTATACLGLLAAALRLVDRDLPGQEVALPGQAGGV